MSSFFCCFGKPSEEESCEDSKPKEAIPPSVQSSSPNTGTGCCCYRCFMTRCQNCGQGRSRYMFLKKAPKVRDAAVDTEIDFGIVLHDFFKADHNDCFGETENIDEHEMRDHRYASLQFDSKPGKLKYVEGSQVFYVEVRDKKMVQFRKNSFDKSISEEEELGMDSDLSADILCDNRSESQRRLLYELEAKSRKRFADNSSHGIVYVSNKCSPANSIDSLTDKRVNRPSLGNIEEGQEQYGEYNLSPVKLPNMTSKDPYNIDGGHFARCVVTPDEVDIQYVDSNKRSECSSASVSVQSCSQIAQDEPEEENRQENCEESEFADISSQSIPEAQQPSDQELYTPTLTASSESTDERSIPHEYFQKSLFTLDWPLPKKLTEDPSTLLITDHPCSLTSIEKKEKQARESSSCPEMSNRSETIYSSSLSTITSRDNSITAETTNMEVGPSASAETQTDLFDDDNVSESTATVEMPKHSVNSVYTETECDSREDDTLEESSKKDTDQVSSSKINSGTDSNNSENDQSTSYLENLSSTDSDCELSLGGSDSSSNSDAPRKKKSLSNSSDTSSSTSSSSSKSVRKLNPIAHGDKEPDKARHKKKSSSSSLEASSSNSSSSCALSSSSSICSSSSSSNRSDSPKEGSNEDLRNGNG